MWLQSASEPPSNSFVYSALENLPRDLAKSLLDHTPRVIRSSVDELVFCWERIGYVFLGDSLVH